MTARALTALADQCHFTQLSLEYAAFYCFTLSVVFVAALYLLVPSRVRNLDREDATQIKWRFFAVTAVCITATLVYPFLFCRTDEKNKKTNARSALELMGWTCEPRYVAGVLMHACLLYTGPIVASLLSIRSACDRMRAGGRDIGYIQTFYILNIEPLLSSFLDGDDSQSWSQARNLIFAPLSEEVVFRGCMISPLLSTGIRPLHVCFIVPLFFGTAHFHHAYLKWKQGMPIMHVVLLTAFQFSYTTLFGAYVSYAFIRTGSIFAISACHSFCNLMGLPKFGFLNRHGGSSLSCLYPWRWFLMLAYLVGMVAFLWGFHSAMLLPSLPGRLVEAMKESLQ